MASTTKPPAAKPTYSIILRDARGFQTRRGRKIPFGQAARYELYYGTKKVSSKKFPSNLTKAGDKRDFLDVAINLHREKIKEQQRPRYQFILYDSRGRQTVQRRPITYSKAVSFDLFYGKKVLASKKKFPRGYRAGEKEEFLETIVSEIEKKKRRALEKKKIEKRAKQEAIFLKKEKARLEKLEKEAKTELDKEYLDRKNAYFDTSITKPEAVIGKIKRVPIKPPSKLWEKEIIFKTVDSEMLEARLRLAILNFTLRKPLYLTQQNIDQVKKKAYELFLPHIKKFIISSKNTENMYIFRIKFNLPMLGEKGIKFERPQGLSMTRTASYKGKNLKFIIKEILDQILATLEKFKIRVLERYLANSATDDLTVTGFTIENIIRRRENLYGVGRKT